MTRRISHVAVLAAMAVSAGFFASATPSSADPGTPITQTKAFNPGDEQAERHRVGNRIMNFRSSDEDLPYKTIGGGRGDGGNGGEGGGNGGGGGGGNGGGGEGGPQ